MFLGTIHFDTKVSLQLGHVRLDPLLLLEDLSNMLEMSNVNFRSFQERISHLRYSFVHIPRVYHELLSLSFNVFRDSNGDLKLDLSDTCKCILQSVEFANDFKHSIGLSDILELNTVEPKTKLFSHLHVDHVIQEKGTPENALQRLSEDIVGMQKMFRGISSYLVHFVLKDYILVWSKAQGSSFPFSQIQVAWHDYSNQLYMVAKKAPDELSIEEEIKKYWW